MEILEVKRRLMDLVGGLAYSDSKLSDYMFDELMCERIKERVSLSDRKKEYEALVWAKQNPDFDFRTCWNEKIPFTKEELYSLIMKAFYQTEEYELLTDDRKPKEGWEL